MTETVDDFYLKERGLWDRISRYDLEGIAGAVSFSSRLAQANSWSNNYAKDVIQEYKKFIYLCCLNDKNLSPSDAVDQAWHLHLLYSKEYWNKFCPDVLEQELHHRPSQGGDKEVSYHQQGYEKLQKLYFEEFKMMPSKEVWPEYASMFSDEIHMARINIRDYWFFLLPKARVPQFIIFLFVMLFLTACLLVNTSFLIGLLAALFGWIANTTLILKRGLDHGHFSTKSYLNKKNSNGGCSGGCGGD
jgi:hypothetical protein